MNLKKLKVPVVSGLGLLTLVNILLIFFLPTASYGNDTSLAKDVLAGNPTVWGMAIVVSILFIALSILSIVMVSKKEGKGPYTLLAGIVIFNLITIIFSVIDLVGLDSANHAVSSIMFIVVPTVSFFIFATMIAKPKK